MSFMLFKLVSRRSPAPAYGLFTKVLASCFVTEPVGSGSSPLSFQDKQSPFLILPLLDCLKPSTD